MCYTVVYVGVYFSCLGEYYNILLSMTYSKTDGGNDLMFILVPCPWLNFEGGDCRIISLEQMFLKIITWWCNTSICDYVVNIFIESFVSSKVLLFYLSITVGVVVWPVFHNNLYFTLVIIESFIQYVNMKLYQKPNLSESSITIIDKRHNSASNVHF